MREGDFGRGETSVEGIDPVAVLVYVKGRHHDCIDSGSAYREVQATDSGIELENADSRHICRTVHRRQELRGNRHVLLFFKKLSIGLHVIWGQNN